MAIWPVKQEKPLAKRLLDFSGGLNNKFSPFLISDTEVSDIQNMHFDEKGTLQKRKGCAKHYASAFATGAVRGIYNYRKDDGTSRLLIAADDKLFYDTPHFVQKYDAQTDWDTGNKINTDAVAEGDVKLATPPAPSFARSTVAYKSDGTQVAADQPRFEAGEFGQAVMVEEGTTNLLTENQSSVETDTTGLTQYGSGVTLSKDTTVAWHGSASLKVVTDGSATLQGFFARIAGTAGTAYSAQVRLRGNGSVSFLLVARDSAGASLGYANTGTFSLVDSWVLKTLSYTAPANTAYIEILVRTGTAQAITFYADGLQIEQKAYATSWTLGGTTRAAEVLTIPTAGVLSAQEGTVEVTVIPSLGSSVVPGGYGFHDLVWATGDTTKGFYVRRKQNIIELLSRRSAGNQVAAYSFNWNAGDRIALAVKWDSTKVYLLVNGQRVITLDKFDAPDDVPLCVGSRPDSAGTNGNALYDDLRISRIARTDAEISADANSGAALAWDYDTTYKLAFDGNLNFPAARAGQWITPIIDISNIADKTSGVVTDGLTLPSGTSITVETRTSADQSTWSAWEALGANGAIVSPANNYLQVRLKLSTNDIAAGNPSAQWLQITYDQTPSVTQLASLLSTTAYYRFDSWGDVCYIVNGENPNKKWDGTTFADQGGSPPVCSLIIVHKNRMFLAGNTSNRSRLYFSDLGNMESWPVLNFIDVGKGDGDRITALGLLMDNLVIFKEKSIWILQGDAPSNFVLRKMVGDAGCVSQESVVAIKNALGFLARDGVRFFDGVRTALASEKIEKTFRGLNGRQLGLAAGVLWDNKYLLAVPNGQSLKNDLVLVFDSLRTAWTIFKGWNISMWVIWRKYGEDKILGASSDTGQVYDMFTGYSDDGAAIDAYAVTKHIDFGVVERQKEIVRALISASSPTAQTADLTISFIPDQGAETGTKTKSVAANGVISLAEVRPKMRGRTVGVKFRNNTLDRGLSVYSVYLEATPQEVA